MLTPYTSYLLKDISSAFTMKIFRACINSVNCDFSQIPHKLLVYTKRKGWLDYCKQYEKEMMEL